MARGHVDLGMLVAEFQENESRIPLLINEITFRSVMQELEMQELGIPPEQLNQVRLEICSAALGYMLVRDRMKKNLSVRCSYQRTIKQLRVVMSSARRLLTELDQLSDEGRDIIRSFEKENVDLELVSQGDIERSSFGHRIYTYSPQDGCVSKTYLHLSGLIEANTAFANMLSHMIDVARPTDKGGRNRNEAIRCWVASMQFVWTGALGRDFTFDAYRGVPVSDAARFCWRLLRLVDPDARWLDFCTGMRDAVKQKHPGRGGKSRPK